MEERIKEQIRTVTEDLRAKEDAFCEQVQAFRKEFFTEQVSDMIDVILNYLFENGNYEYRYYVKYIVVDSPKIELERYNFKIDDIFLNYNDRISTQKHTYDDTEIKEIKKHAECLTKKRELFQILQDNATTILDTVANDYAKITAKQTNDLDEVMRMLDFEEKPLKHIKVTVEYI